jgi:hypothetical protein
MKSFARLWSAVATCSMLVAAPACAAITESLSDGFSIKTVQQFVQSEKQLKGNNQKQNARFEAAVNSAAQIHDGLTAKVDALRTLWGTEGDKAVSQLIPVGADKEMNHLWGAFISGAVTLIGAGLSDAPVIGYYNPMLDGWVVAKLKRNKASADLTDMAVITGDKLRSIAGVGLPHSTKYKSPLFTAYQTSATAFEKLYPPNSATAPHVNIANSANEYNTVMTRIIQMVTIVETETKRPELAKKLSEFESAVAKGNALEVRALFAARTTTPPEWLAAISAPVRQDLKPAAIYKTQDGMQIAYVSPEASRVVVLLNIDNAMGSEPKLSDIIISDYAYINGAKE